MPLRASAIIFWALTLAAQMHLAGCDPVNPAPGFEPPPVAPGAPQAAPDESTLYGRLQSPNKDVRIEAILQAGREKDAKAVPYLVDRLGEGYAEVRFAAIVALEKITGTDRGYRYWAAAAQRDEAIARWRQWLRSEAPGGAGGKGR
jgi:HEAT repeat protein